jgi:hypothetical protein
MKSTKIGYKANDKQIKWTNGKIRSKKTTTIAISKEKQRKLVTDGVNTCNIENHQKNDIEKINEQGEVSHSNIHKKELKRRMPVEKK